MPLYTLDGELAAIASAEQGDAVPVRTTIDRLLERARTGEQIASFGMSFQNRTDVLARVFGDRGVVVTTVTGSSPAAAAGARPGDVLLAIGEREIDNASEAASVVGALPIGVATTLSVRRAGRITKMNARPATSFELDALTRLNESPSGPEARLLLSGATLLAAGIPPSASVLLFNGRAITSRAQTDRELRRVKTPVPVLLRYRSRQFFVVVEPVP
jgi:membrane-associated protease RseP (regulator of RpoE activity)